MTMSIDLGGGGNSFQFDNIGDTVTGQILNLEELQQTDLDSGLPRTFENGQPMMMYRVELQTQQRDDAFDDGKRSVYLKGSRKPESQSSLAAVLAAVKAATGTTAVRVGGTLTLSYVGDGEARRRGHNAPKLYAAQYQAPALDLGGPAPTQQAPAPQQAVQQQGPDPATQPGWAPQQPTPQPTPAPAPQQPAQQPAPAVPGLPAGVDAAALMAAMQAAGINPQSQP